MKKIILILLLIINGSVIIAQPILTTANFVPSVNDLQQYYVADSNSVVDPTIGANVIFDYTLINSTGVTQNRYIVDPTTTTYAGNFPSATYTDTTGGAPINKNYSKVEATDSLTNIGLVVNVNTYGTVVAEYTQDPETLMKFPFIYGDNYSDNYSGTFTIISNGIVTNGNGTATVNADAWGTLLLPFGVSIDSVLRVRTVESLVTDTIVIPLPPVIILPIVVSAEYISYYKPSLSKFPILSFINGSYTQDNNVIDSNRTIISQYPLLTVGVDDLNKDNFSISLFPNPSNGNSTSLTFEMETQNFIKIDLLNSLGQHVLTIFSGNLQKGKKKIQVKTSNLTKGLYFVNINVNNKTVTKKLIIE